MDECPSPPKIIASSSQPILQNWDQLQYNTLEPNPYAFPSLNQLPGIRDFQARVSRTYNLPADDICDVPNQILFKRTEDDQTIDEAGKRKSCSANTLKLCAKVSQTLILVVCCVIQIGFSIAMIWIGNVFRNDCSLNPELPWQQVKIGSVFLPISIHTIVCVSVIVLSRNNINNARLNSWKETDDLSHGDMSSRPIMQRETDCPSCSTLDDDNRKNILRNLHKDLFQGSIWQSSNDNVNCHESENCCNRLCCRKVTFVYILYVTLCVLLTAVKMACFYLIVEDMKMIVHDFREVKYDNTASDDYYCHAVFFRFSCCSIAVIIVLAALHIGLLFYLAFREMFRLTFCPSPPCRY